MQMCNPPHPGETLKELWLDPLGLNITETADILGVSRKSVSDIVNEHMGISPKMALRLSIAFDTTAEFWLNMQMQYDLWRERQMVDKLKVRRVIVNTAA